MEDLGLLPHRLTDSLGFRFPNSELTTDLGLLRLDAPIKGWLWWNIPGM